MDASSSNLLIFDRICTGGVVEKYDNVYTSTVLKKMEEFKLPFVDLVYKYALLAYSQHDMDADVFNWFRSAFRCCNSQNKNEIISDAIEVLRYFQRLIQPPVLEAILYKGLVFECYRVNIQNSQIMHQLFDLLGSHEQYFVRFHEPVTIRLLDSRSKREISCLLSFLTFYLEHARRLRLEYDGIRFVDVQLYGRYFPVSLAARFKSWRAVLRYLQFGAKFEEVRKKSNGEVVAQTETRDTMHYLTIFLNEILVWPAMWVTDEKAAAIYCSKLDPATDDLFHTIKIILRAVKCFPSDCVAFLDSKVSYSFVRHKNVEHMFPTFKQRCRDANELQHACRCKIRACLNRKFLLPWGINELPIPRKLKKYLNLLSG